jgi:lysophospholipase L1-like esterase
LVYVDSEELIEEDGRGINAFDGNPDTLWVSEWSQRTAQLPHEIQINLGTVYELTRFRYLPTGDDNPYGRIKDYAFYISSDGQSWGNPVATGTFPNTAAEQEVAFNQPVTGQFIRLVALSEVHNGPWTAVGEIKVVGKLAPTAPKLISQQGWSLVYVDSEELIGEDGRGINAFDGNPDTFWVSEWSQRTAQLPHEIQINLGTAYELTRFRYLPTGDDNPYGRIKDYAFYISSDGQSWGNPVATGTFPNTAAEQEVAFNQPVTGQFIRLVALSEVHNGPWTAVGEINMLVEGQCDIPSVRLVQPLTRHIQGSSNLKVVASTCLNPNSHPGWGVKFTLDGGDQAGGKERVVTSPPYEHTFTGLDLAEHEVGVFIVDSTGKPVSGTDTHDRSTQVGIGDYYVAMGDSITVGVGDDIDSDNRSQDGRNAGLGYTPILNDRLTAAKGYPHSVMIEAVPGIRAAGGLERLPEVISRHPEAEFYLVQYGTNDSSSLPVPSGRGLKPGDPGYPGSYKDTMQRIINAIVAAGQAPYLAKVPYTLKSAARNNLIAEYNAVVDELVAASGIPVMPPDFFSYFQAHQNEFSDDLHPNGIGYQSMAELWFNSLQ